MKRSCNEEVWAQNRPKCIVTRLFLKILMLILLKTIRNSNFNGKEKAQSSLIGGDHIFGLMRCQHLHGCLGLVI